MTKRQVSKRTRFEVLKRDRFQCAYCGARAPDVELEVDHILAIANGGTDDFLNLVTACVPCNRGKAAIPLSENQALEKQVAEIERIEAQVGDIHELRKRRAEATELLELQIDTIDEAICQHTGRSLSDAGRKTVMRWLTKESVEALMTAVDSASEAYARPHMTDREWERFFKKIPAIAAFRKRHGLKSEAFRKALYAAGIMRNRFNKGDFAEFCDDNFQDIYEELFEFLPPYACEEMADEMVKCAKTYPHYPMFRDELLYVIPQLREAVNG